MESSLTKASTSSDDELSAQLANITILVTRYGLLVLVILGSVGNTLNFVVFSQQKLRTSPCILYLFTGSCIDLVLTMAIALPLMLSTYNLDYSATIGVLCKMRHFTYYSFSSLSVWMVALATFDRFLISSPLTTRRQMSSFRNACRLIIGASVVLLLIFGDLFYCADIVVSSTVGKCTATTSKQCGFYNQIARLLTVLCIPEMMILVFGIGIIRNLKSLKMMTTGISQNESQQYRIKKSDKELIKLLVGQIVMLTIAWLPLGIQRIYALITYDLPKSKLRNGIENLSDGITSVIARCNNSLSFYIYLLLGNVIFRQTFAKWFRRVTRRGTVTPAGGTIQFPRRTIY